MSVAHRPAGPVIYEIHTWLWLDELSRTGGCPITLGDVPDAEWDRLAALAIDAVWLMGVWERSPIGAEVARGTEDIGRAAAELLAPATPFSPELVVGSPYCVRRYVPDERIGGFAGLERARLQLRRRGLKLLLDFVPNHVAPDHAWAAEHPDYLIAGDEGDLERRPNEFTRLGDRIVAFGRDPFSDPWSDVIQVNTFHPGVRADTVELLSTLADYCDGVRCDMAMLAINEVFRSTWGQRAGPVPAREYWSGLIRAVRDTHPDFVFIAEAYWDREWDLLQQGFDYCYDKVLYDRLRSADATAVRLHLGADISYQQRLVRFIENHDESRSAAVMGPEAARAAAVTIATLPGATLYYDGQFEGYHSRLPVALGRRAREPVDADLRDFYTRLLTAAREVRGGEWRLCPVTGWPDNDTSRNVVAWSWTIADAIFVVAVNLSDRAAQGQVRFPSPPSAVAPIVLADLLSGQTYRRDPSELLEQGMYVALGPYGFHLLHLPA